MNIEQRAHDLALAYVKYQLDIEREGTDAVHDEVTFLQMYQDAYDNFYEMLTEGM